MWHNLRIDCTKKKGAIFHAQQCTYTHTHTHTSPHSVRRRTDGAIRSAPDDHQATRSSEPRNTRAWTRRPHTQFGDGQHHVDGDWSRHQTSAFTRTKDHTQLIATDYPRLDKSDGLSELVKEDHTHSSATDNIIWTATGRATRPAPETTTNQQTTYSSERRITRAWTGRQHTGWATDYIMLTATGRAISPAPDVPHITHTYHIHIHTHTFIHQYIQYIHTYTRLFIHSFIHTYIHTSYIYCGARNCTLVDFAITNSRKRVVSQIFVGSHLNANNVVASPRNVRRRTDGDIRPAPLGNCLIKDTFLDAKPRLN